MQESALDRAPVQTYQSQDRSPSETVQEAFLRISAIRHRLYILSGRPSFIIVVMYT
jgi:hypothetical protein